MVIRITPQVASRRFFAQSGSTRVDVVIIVMCLVMLTVVALPRYVNVSQDTRHSQAITLSSSVESAVRRANTLWQASGEPQSLQFDNGTVEMVNGYPSAATLAVLMRAADLTVFDFNDGSWQHTGVSRRYLCGVSYWPPDRSGQLPVIQSYLSDC